MISMRGGRRFVSMHSSRVAMHGGSGSIPGGVGGSGTANGPGMGCTAGFLEAAAGGDRRYVYHSRRSVDLAGRHESNEIHVVMSVLNRQRRNQMMKMMKNDGGDGAARKSAEPAKPPLAPPAAPEKKKSTIVTADADADADTELCKFSALLTILFERERLTPQHAAILYWDNAWTTIAVFFSILIALLAMTRYSMISLIAQLCLSVMLFTITYRTWYAMETDLSAEQHGGEHPFRRYLETDANDLLLSFVPAIPIQAIVKKLVRLFFVDNIVESLKFAACLCLISYVGFFVDLLTALIGLVVVAFTLPVLWDLNKHWVYAVVSILQTNFEQIK